MAATKVSDVITPEVFNPYVIERTATLSALVQAGIISQDDELNRLAMTGGRLLDLPFWADLTGADEILQDDGSLTPGAIGTGQDQAVLWMRGRAFGGNDLAAALAGDDPMRAIGDLVAAYWARREQTLLINVLAGVFADNVDNDSGDMVNDVSIEDGDNAAAANLMRGEAVIDAAQTMGDAKDRLTAIGVHSLVEARMAKGDLIEYERDSAGQILKRTFMGLAVIVDDAMPTASGATSGTKYTSYLYGAGAIARGDGQAKVPTEVDRDSLAGEDYLINRRHSVLHPRGIAWTDTTVTDTSPRNPSNANAALAVNWNRVYERKNVRLASLITNG
tara:strand:- start:47 stop:1045 length:999 start_codon:yes stop_codon:yes gene_type:complete